MFYNIKDVAREAKVSPSTVSNYLNKSAFVSEEKIKSIQKAIKKLDYKPNRIAIQLRKGKAKIIGVIVPEIDNFYYSALVRGMYEVANQNDYSIILACNYYNPKIEENEIRDLLSSSISGFISVTTEYNEKFLEEFKRENINTVFIDRIINNKDGYSINIDNFKAVYKGIDYLISKGHRNIYFLSQPMTLPTLRFRLEGYKKALSDNRIKINESKILLNERCKINKMEGGYEIFSNIAECIEKPAAIFGTSDLIVVGAMKAAIEKGFKVPEDISFLGFDNIAPCKYINPSLTTIKQPKKKMGRIGMEVLIGLINNKKIKQKNIILDTEIIERESVLKILK